MFPDQFQTFPSCFCTDSGLFLYFVLFWPLFGCLVLLWWSHVGGMRQYSSCHQVCLCIQEVFMDLFSSVFSKITRTEVTTASFQQKKKKKGGGGRPQIRFRNTLSHSVNMKKKSASWQNRRLCPAREDFLKKQRQELRSGEHKIHSTVMMEKNAVIWRQEELKLESGNSQTD